MEKPYVPFYKPDGMSDEEYQYEIHIAEQKLAEWEQMNRVPKMDSNRIRDIQEKTAYPNSISVQQALMQVWNECEQAHQLEMKKFKTNICSGDFTCDCCKCK